MQITLGTLGVPIEEYKMFPFSISPAWQISGDAILVGRPF
jgi:hypothetical protein